MESQDRTDPPTAPEAEPLPTTGPRIILVVGVALMTAFFVYQAIRSDATAASEGDVTAYDWSVVDVNGDAVKLSDYKGRAVLLNVWATWCPPCVGELPSLAKLSERPELKEANVAVLLVSVDQGREPVVDFLGRNDLGDADVLVAMDRPPGEFATTAIPATFIIDPDGTIVDSELGARDWNTDETVDLLTRLARR